MPNQMLLSFLEATSTPSSSKRMSDGSSSLRIVWGRRLPG
jgi:hypothetical protein